MPYVKELGGIYYNPHEVKSVKTNGTGSCAEHEIVFNTGVTINYKGYYNPYAPKTEVLLKDLYNPSYISSVTNRDGTVSTQLQNAHKVSIFGSEDAKDNITLSDCELCYVDVSNDKLEDSVSIFNQRYGNSIWNNKARRSAIDSVATYDGSTQIGGTSPNIFAGILDLFGWSETFQQGPNRR